VLDPVDQLLFLLERYLCHLGPALSPINFKTSFLVFVHAGSFCIGSWPAGAGVLGLSFFLLS
jgi:hypothetical protein